MTLAASLPMLSMRPWEAQAFALERLKTGGKSDPVLEDAGKASLLKERRALRHAAQEFESVFLGLVIKGMRDSIEKNEMFHGGHAEDTFQGMLDAEYAQKLSASGGFGIADAIVRSLDRSAHGPAPKGGVKP